MFERARPRHHDRTGSHPCLGLYQRSTDRLFVVKGLVSLVMFDGRVGSPTNGVVNEFKVSERSPGLLVIPPNLEAFRDLSAAER